MSSPFKSTKQNLSPKASGAKKKRDLAAANTRDREIKRADSQKKHRDNPSQKGKDYDHKDKKFKTPHNNRGNGGKGTKNE